MNVRPDSSNSNELNHLEQAIKEIKALKEEIQMREKFVSTLAHDLRTPLSSVKICAQLILRDPGNVDKNQQVSVKILRNIDRMDRMIKDLLDANRLKAGEVFSYTMNYCDLKEITHVTIRDLSSAHGDRFLLQVENDNIFGFWNEEGIRRVIENLANNAIKYGAPHSLINIILKQSESFVKIIVHNLGDPIAKEDQEYLFQPYHRSRFNQHNGESGWGLGLTLVKGVTEAHGGNVTVTSDEENGTDFIITLPRDSRPFQLLN